VERDAIAIWWYNREQRTAVNLASCGSPYLAEIQNYYRCIGREIWALDVTTDLGIPVFVAASRRCGAGPEELVMGFGAGFDADEVLIHALMEMTQLLVVAHAARNPALQHWLNTATLVTEPYLAPIAGGGCRTLDGDPTPAIQDPSAAVKRCEQVASRHGLELLVLDQTRPDIGLPVAKVVVPGLRHFWPRYAAGRLYDEPVRTGRRNTPTEEENLNPTPLFL
jgi:ribosomal protein S12 methylthiotransferase accessory factor YcaO